MKMTFTCDQDWNAMNPSANGRSCQMCQKEVHDFTDKSAREIATLSNKKEICGLFRVEQIDTSLKSLRVPAYRSFFKVVVATGIVFGLQSNMATATALPAKTKIELSNIVAGTTELAVVQRYTSLSETRENIDVSTASKPQKRKKFYLTKRFPFIVRRASHIMGRFRM